MHNWWELQQVPFIQEALNNRFDWYSLTTLDTLDSFALWCLLKSLKFFKYPIEKLAFFKVLVNWPSFFIFYSFNSIFPPESWPGTVVDK